MVEVDPLQAAALATELGVTVWSTEDVAGLDRSDLDILNDETDDSWSAMTMRVGPANLIIYKPASSEGRRNNVIMHELAHIVLGHHLAPAHLLDDGSLVPANFDQDQEDEADWFAGALLLPRPALMNIRRRGLTDQQAADLYGVSPAMLNWRMRMTGVDYQLRNSRARLG